MSFKTLDPKQLRLVVDGFGLDVAEKATKPVLLAAIAEDGNISWDEAVNILKSENAWDEEDEKTDVATKAEAKAAYEARPKDTLLKMLRANRSYEVRGYRFTADHPFALATAEDAEWIVEHDEGFRYATPKEATEFYS
jgi:hypothetical protein